VNKMNQKMFDDLFVSPETVAKDECNSQASTTEELSLIKSQDVSNSKKMNDAGETFNSASSWC
jgi:hypothetical protein